mgnify:FL=1
MDTNKKLNKKQVANILAVVPGGTSYTGRKFSLAVQNTYTLNNGDFAWDGGSKTEVFFVKRLTDGRFEVINAEDVMADPVRDGGQTTTFTIPADAVVVERCFFCGKDMGFTFFVSGNSRLQITASTKMLAA